MDASDNGLSIQAIKDFVALGPAPMPENPQAHVSTTLEGTSKEPEKRLGGSGGTASLQETIERIDNLLQYLPYNVPFIAKLKRIAARNNAVSFLNSIICGGKKEQSDHLSIDQKLRNTQRISDNEGYSEADSLYRFNPSYMPGD
jgi:hypothetical protein